jgi:hypothetical protein
MAKCQQPDWLGKSLRKVCDIISIKALRKKIVSSRRKIKLLLICISAGKNNLELVQMRKSLPQTQMQISERQTQIKKAKTKQRRAKNFSRRAAGVFVLHNASEREDRNQK